MQYLIQSATQEDTCDSLSIPYSTVAEIQISGSATKRQENPRVTLLLNTLPIIGKDPITPRCTTGQTDVTPAVTFRLGQDSVAQFRKALKSRSLVYIRMTCDRATADGKLRDISLRPIKVLNPQY